MPISGQQTEVIRAQKNSERMTLTPGKGLDTRKDLRNTFNCIIFETFFFFLIAFLLLLLLLFFSVKICSGVLDFFD